MDIYQQILVIFLASALAVLLVLSIVAVVLLLKIISRVKKVTDKAEHVAEQAEQITEALKSTSGSFLLGRLLSSIGKSVKSKASQKSKKG